MEKMLYNWTENGMALLTYSNNEKVMNAIGFNPWEVGKTFYCDLHTVEIDGVVMLKIQALNPTTNRRCTIHTSGLTSIHSEELEFRTANSVYKFAKCKLN